MTLMGSQAGFVSSGPTSWIWIWIRLWIPLWKWIWIFSQFCEFNVFDVR